MRETRTGAIAMKSVKSKSEIQPTSQVQEGGFGRSAIRVPFLLQRLAALTDWKAVQDSWRQALDKIHSDPEGAITATRTLLESTCKHICDERGVSYENNWDLSRLYKATAGAMEIAPDQHKIRVVARGLSPETGAFEPLGNSLLDTAQG